MSQHLLSPPFLFRFAVPCQATSATWNNNSGIDLPPKHRLPNLGELSTQPNFADVRAAWNDAGLYFTVRVEGKQQPPWCRYDRPEDSDGLHLWIDTRNTHNIHRASRFCHRLLFCPTGEGRALDEPIAAQLLIHRARENPAPVPIDGLQVRSEKRVDGYVLQCCVPAESLTGFNPADHPQLGFFYGVLDRELGWQTFSLGTEFPFDEDPSTWGTLELADGS